MEYTIMYALESEREHLKEIFQKRAFLRRAPPEPPFRLASGASSYVFFDCKLVTQDPEGISIIAKIIFDHIRHYEGLGAIGGVADGAIPICTAVALLSYQEKHPVPAFWVRREKKTHGTEKIIEGNLAPGAKVIIVDDVTTKGNSVGDAVARVLENGSEVLEIVTLVDREEGARQKFEQRGIKFTPIFVMSEFGSP